jgi:hypothetical protein
MRESGRAHLQSPRPRRFAVLIIALRRPRFSQDIVVADCFPGHDALRKSGHEVRQQQPNMGRQGPSPAWHALCSPRADTISVKLESTLGWRRAASFVRLSFWFWLPWRRTIDWLLDRHDRRRGGQRRTGRPKGSLQRFRKRLIASALKIVLAYCNAEPKSITRQRDLVALHLITPFNRMFRNKEEFAKHHVYNFQPTF